MHNFKELNIWKRSIKVAVAIYKIAAGFPSAERYELTSQIKRAVVSIASNVAEGAGRNTDKEFNHFLGIALGSSFELYTQLIIAGELGLVTEKAMEPVLCELDEIQKMIRGFKETLKTN
jgi:four helix bundle protein